jgi:hypothetical protein
LKPLSSFDEPENNERIINGPTCQNAFPHHRHREPRHENPISGNDAGFIKKLEKEKAALLVQLAKTQTEVAFLTRKINPPQASKEFEEAAALYARAAKVEPNPSHQSMCVWMSLWARNPHAFDASVVFDSASGVFTGGVTHKSGEKANLVDAETMSKIKAQCE